MKSMMLTCVALCAGLLAAAPAKTADSGKAASSAKQTSESGKMTLDEAREKIAEIIKNPEKVGEVASQLSAADQKTFMVDLNKAIQSMPGSNELKTAKYLAIEREILLAAEKGNLQPLVATMFKTVPLESLTILAERYGDDLFNRSADATKTFTDEQFTEIASSTVKEVAKECAGLPDAAPRDTLAIYLFERASNGTIPELEDTLLEVAIADPQVRAVAKNEWLAQAKSDSADKYSSLLGYAEAGRAPNVDVTLKLAGPQVMTAVLNDLAQGVTDANGQQIFPITQGEHPSERGITTPGQAQAVTASTSTEQPKTSAIVPWNPSYSRETVQEVKEVIKKAEEIPEPEPEPEPKPYPYQG